MEICRSYGKMARILVAEGQLRRIQGSFCLNREWSCSCTAARVKQEARCCCYDGTPLGLHVQRGKDSYRGCVIFFLLLLLHTNISTQATFSHAYTYAYLYGYIHTCTRILSLRAHSKGCVSKSWDWQSLHRNLVCQGTCQQSNNQMMCSSIMKLMWWLS